MDFPVNYILEVIYRNCKRVHAKGQNIYNFECPICREGKSSGKKRRGFFFAPENYFHCKNCQRSWSVADWIMEVEGISFKQVCKDANDHDNTFNEIIGKHSDTPAIKLKQYSLPYDSINLSDPLQLQYHRNNKEVQMCLKYIRDRRLNTAVNRPKTFYISLTDKIYRNRLCIPFYDINGKIVYYQARALYERDEEIAKYLSKQGDKSLFGINNISSSLEYIFIFEGPIDSMFCQNGVAVCGLSLTEKQKEQLDKYRLYDKIWILDNQLDNQEVCEKYNEIIDRGEKIFFWPEEFKEYKDINEVCVATGKDRIPPKLFIKYALSGMAAKLKLAELCKISG
jgi:hypothetical protein